MKPYKQLASEQPIPDLRIESKPGSDQARSPSILESTNQRFQGS